MVTFPAQGMAVPTPDASRIRFATCPLCDSGQHVAHTSAVCAHHPSYHPDLAPVMRWRRCLACLHIFTDGYFTQAAEAKVFARVLPGQSAGADMEAQRAVSARMIERVLPWASSGAWLDVGFGNASLLLTAQEVGFEPVGLDLRQTNVDALRRLNVSAHCMSLLDMSPGRAFSVISMADVLEHVAYPTPLLVHAHSLLRPDGVLLVSMPNADSPLWKAWDATDSNPYWSELEHYHNFGRDRLYALLRQTGFEPLRYGISERYRACMEVTAKRV